MLISEVTYNLPLCAQLIFIQCVVLNSSSLVDTSILVEFLIETRKVFTSL